MIKYQVCCLLHPCLKIYGKDKKKNIELVVSWTSFQVLLFHLFSVALFLYKYDLWYFLRNKNEFVISCHVVFHNHTLHRQLLTIFLFDKKAPEDNIDHHLFLLFWNINNISMLLFLQCTQKFWSKFEQVISRSIMLYNLSLFFILIYFYRIYIFIWYDYELIWRKLAFALSMLHPPSQQYSYYLVKAEGVNYSLTYLKVSR